MLKKKVFYKCVLPALTWIPETWVVNTRDEQNLGQTMLEIIRRDRNKFKGRHNNAWLVLFLEPRKSNGGGYDTWLVENMARCNKGVLLYCNSMGFDDDLCNMQGYPVKTNVPWTVHEENHRIMTGETSSSSDKDDDISMIPSVIMMSVPSVRLFFYTLTVRFIDIILNYCESPFSLNAIVAL